MSVTDAPVAGRLAPIPARGEEQTGRFISLGGRDNEPTEFLNTIFEAAVVSGASDIDLIHHELEGMSSRMKLNGEWQYLDHVLDAQMGKMAKSKVCSKAKLDDQERVKEQDGRAYVVFGGRRVDIRINITPSVSGYGICCRLLDSNNAKVSLDDIDIPFILKESMKAIATRKEGVMLISGPTGSGKTTTLYALLRFLNTPKRKIYTVENPVEYLMPGVFQTEVAGEATFASRMRAALRHAPDVIMVGEIRDEETAGIAKSAGTSGHMVLSTVHANSAAETITRMIGFGLNPFEVTSMLAAVVAQRLVRRIDPDVPIQWDKPNDVEREWLMRRNLYAEQMKVPRVPKDAYKGRLPLVEMIVLTPEIQHLLEAGNGDVAALVAPIVDLAAKQEQFETLAQAGVRAAIEGKTTLEQAMIAAGEIAHVPEDLRWEQKLIYQGRLKVSDLEQARREIAVARAAGRIVSLKVQLVSSNAITEEDIAAVVGGEEYEAGI